MDKKKKWTVKDVITTVLLSAVLIVIQLVINMVCMANDFVSMVLSVGSTITAVGMFRTMPTSSNGMWVPPLYRAVMPGSEPMTFTVLRP